MTIWTVLAVGSGGMAGAVLRYIISTRFNGNLPVGTFLVNIVGSFFIGFIFGLELPANETLFWTAGVAGALTTYSTFMKEAIVWWQRGEQWKAIFYIALTFCCGLGLAYIGYRL